MEEQLKEYIVTLHRHEDLDEFYEDMETPGGNLYIPDRTIEATYRLPDSRNTQYMLFDKEVDTICNDPRVRGVTKVYSSEHYRRSLRSLGTISSNQWSKDYSVVDPGDINWAILRCTEGSNRLNWGSDGTSIVSGTTTLTSTGKNVDIVILDTGHGDPDSPEFAVNPDGTGGSRYIKYNWFQHTNEVRGSGSNTTYIYPTNTSAGSSGVGHGFNNSTLSSSHGHAYHVTGIAAGNTQGWARDANIYGLSIYCEDSSGAVPPHLLFKYILAFHNAKPINPNTGIKNPTIVNNSWGEYIYFGKTQITKIHYRGNDYTSNIQSSTDLQKFGVVVTDAYDATILFYNSAAQSQMEECVDAGIIFVGAAGNENYKLDNDPNENELTSTRDFYNKIFGSTYDYSTDSYVPNQQNYIHRGSIATYANSICVSNTGNQVSQKRANSVNTGPRVDVFSPGVAINSCTHTLIYAGTTSISDRGGDTSVDPRTGGDYFVKLSLTGAGATSMASPQVCGVLACLLENNPRMNQQDCKNWIIKNATLDQIGGSIVDAAPPNITTVGASEVNWTSNESLYGASNRYLYYKKQRETFGYVTAQQNNNVRKTSGMTFPRRRFI